MRGLEHKSCEDQVRELEWLILKKKRLKGGKGMSGQRSELVISKVSSSLGDSVIL